MSDSKIHEQSETVLGNESEGGGDDRARRRSHSVSATIAGGKNSKTQSTCSKGAVLMRSLSMFLTGGKKLNSHQGTGNESISKKRKMRQKFNDNKGKMYPKTLEMIKKKTKFTKEELEALCQIYKKLISNCQSTSKTLTAGTTASIVKPNIVEGIDRIVFRELLHSTFDIITEETLMERIFCAWDKDNEGAPLRLEGWLTGLSVFLRGTLAEKASFCFRVYDLNADGFITKDEMFTLLRNCLIKQPQDEDPDEGVKDLVEIILKKFDIDKDGKVSFEDYSQTVKEEPLLIEAFGQCLPSESATISFFSTLNST